MLHQDPCGRIGSLIDLFVSLTAASRSPRVGAAPAPERGRGEGRQEGIRTAIEALCEVLAIELSPKRHAALAAMDEAALDALLAHLRQHRAWPS